MKKEIEKVITFTLAVMIQIFLGYLLSEYWKPLGSFVTIPFFAPLYIYILISD